MERLLNLAHELLMLGMNQLGTLFSLQTWSYELEKIRIFYKLADKDSLCLPGYKYGLEHEISVNTTLSGNF